MHAIKIISQGKKQDSFVLVGLLRSLPPDYTRLRVECFMKMKMLKFHSTI